MNKHRKTLIKLDELKVRGGELLFEQLSLRANTTLSATMILFLSNFQSPLSGRAFTLYSFFLHYSDRTLVYHLSLHLSTCLISHLLWLSVNGSGWNCIVQRSSPHKCGQRSFCSAFNVVVATFASRYFYILIIFVYAWSSSLSLDLPGGSPRLPKYLLNRYSLYPRSIDSSDYITSYFLYVIIHSEHLLPSYSYPVTPPQTYPCLRIGPKARYTNLGSYPHRYCIANGGLAEWIRLGHFAQHT